jgi:hypothetical protein
VRREGFVKRGLSANKRNAKIEKKVRLNRRWKKGDTASLLKDSIDVYKDSMASPSI